MESLQTLGRVQLVDLLNKETTRYYKMIKEGERFKEQLECKLIISNILKEIDQRKKVTQ